MINTAEIKHYLLELQSTICTALSAIDGKLFQRDHWDYQNGTGGGLTCVLENGAVIEKGGVNFSHIKACQLPEAIINTQPKLRDHSFQAMGVSLVIHPKNPFVPTSHMNVRFFLAEKPDQEPIWWFGGGFDLTPFYGFIEDCILWHQTAFDACAPFGETVYQKYKKQCDQYFYLPHRKESRGIGGLFFDYLNEWAFEKCFAFMRAIGDHYLKAYTPIVNKRKDFEFNAKQREFQLYRRGRYAEFNLGFDRGTHFGLQSEGRTESILISMPPLAKWKYNYQAPAGSAEEKLYTDFLPAKDWLDRRLSQKIKQETVETL